MQISVLDFIWKKSLGFEIPYEMQRLKCDHILEQFIGNFYKKIFQKL